MTDDRTVTPDPDAPLNREQRRAARFRPKAGLPDPHMVEIGPTADGEPPGAPEDDPAPAPDDPSSSGDGGGES